MSNIVSNSETKLPRAIARVKDGITLYWVDELELSGLHPTGLARLLGCHHSAVTRTIEKVKHATHDSNGFEPRAQIDVVMAECDLGQGLQPVSIYSENDIVVILEAIVFSNIKVEVRKRASDVLKRLAAAGFKLAVMLELAPEKLKASIKVPATSLAEWHEDRLQGKIDRRSLTDTIQLLCQYAVEQGSSQPERYYIHFSNLVNKYIIAAPIDSKIKDKRNRMNRNQLHNIRTIETTLAKLIEDRMIAGDDYREIYQVCKDRVAAIAAVLDIEPQPLLEQSNQRLINQSLYRSLKVEEE
jgi:hypothetical protein